MHGNQVLQVHLWLPLPCWAAEMLNAREGANSNITRRVVTRVHQNLERGEGSHASCGPGRRWISFLAFEKNMRALGKPEVTS